MTKGILFAAVPYMRNQRIFAATFGCRHPQIPIDERVARRIGRHHQNRHDLTVSLDGVGHTDHCSGILNPYMAVAQIKMNNLNGLYADDLFHERGHTKFNLKRPSSDLFAIITFLRCMRIIIRNYIQFYN
jgi:hypothetical protein